MDQRLGRNVLRVIAALERHSEHVHASLIQRRLRVSSYREVPLHRVQRMVDLLAATGFVAVHPHHHISLKDIGRQFVSQLTPDIEVIAWSRVGRIGESVLHTMTRGRFGYRESERASGRTAEK